MSNSKNTSNSKNNNKLDKNIGIIFTILMKPSYLFTKAKSLNNNPFVMFLMIFISAIIFLNPSKSFPINDDWNNQLQVIAFSVGDYRIHSAIDASFILQPWLGYLWSLLFGYSFFSLRMLTVLFSILFAFYLLKTLNKDLSNVQKLFVLCLVMFNPIIFHSSLTFMTEIYFLFGIIFSYYYFNKYLESNKDSHLLTSSIFLGLTILFRQISIVSFIAYFIVLLLTKKINIKNFILTFLPVLIGLLIFNYYPRADIIVSNDYEFVDTTEITKRFNSLILVIPLVAFSLSPILFTKIKNIKLQVIFSILSIFISYFIFKYDILPLGNVFYIECLLCKTKYRSIFSLFDNVIFKLFLSYVVSYSLLNLLRTVFYYIKDQSYTKDLTLLFLTLGYFAILIFPEDIYDRYAISGIVFLTILVVQNIKSNYNKLLLILFMFISFSLNFDFYRVSENIFDQVLEIKSRFNHVQSVYSIDIYSKYLMTLENKDYVGVYDGDYMPTEYICFVQNYTTETDSTLFNIFDNIEKSLEDLVENPSINNRSKKNISYIKNNTDKIIINTDYPSILYNFVGRKTFVGTYCID